MANSITIADPPVRRPWIGLVLAAVVLVIAGIGLYVWHRANRVVFPEISTEGIDSDVTQAIEKARANVIAEPKSAAAWGQVGLVLFANDLYKDCRPWLAQAEKLDPSDVRWSYYLALSILFERPEEALPPLTRAVEKKPGDPIIRLRLAEALMMLDRADEADEAYLEVLKAMPDNARAKFGHGSILLRRGQTGAAIPLLKEAAERPECQKSARSRLAEAYQITGDDKGAEEQRRLAAAAPRDGNWYDPWLKDIESLQTGLQNRLTLANNTLALGNTEQAIEMLSDITRDHPNSADAHLALGKALSKVNNVRDAEEEFNKAIELNPNLPDAHFMLGSVQLLRKDYAGAEKRYRRVIELRPDHSIAHHQLAECRLNQGDKPGAIAEYREAVRYRPGLGESQLKLGELLLEAGQFDDAAQHLEAAEKLLKDAPKDKARKLLEQARARRRG